MSADSNIRPLGTNILIKPEKAEKVTASGIELPETINKQTPLRGEVLAVGMGKTMPDGTIIPLEVKVGDRVAFKQYSNTEIEHNGETYYVIDETNILAVLY